MEPRAALWQGCEQHRNTPGCGARSRTRNSRRGKAPHCPAHLFTWSRKWPHFLLLAADGNNWEDDRRSPHRSPGLCQQRLPECGLYVACVCGMLLCVCVHAYACAFCMSQPLKICLFLFYNRFLSLCKAPGRAWRSRNCLQVVLQASSRPLLSPCSAS